MSYDEIKSKEKSIKLLTEENSDLKKIITDKDSSLNTNKEKQSVDSTKITSLEKESTFLKNELSMCKRDSEDLMNNMEICRQNMDSYAKRESECRYKVSFYLFYILNIGLRLLWVFVRLIFSNVVPTVCDYEILEGMVSEGDGVGDGWK